MKKFILLGVIALFMSFAARSQNSSNIPPTTGDTATFPYWIGMMQDPSVNFFKVQHAFNTYWNGRKITKGCGWKPFKRWNT